MTLVGKICTVLIFIMSLVFMSFSVVVYSTHKNWMELVENKTAETGKPLGLKYQLEKAKKDNRQSQDKLEELKTDLAAERAARTQALAKLESNLNLVNQELADSIIRLNEKTKLATDAAAAVTLAQNNLTAIQTELKGNAARITSLREELLMKGDKVLFLTDELNQQRGKLSILVARQDSLIAQINKQKNVLKAYRLTEESPTSSVEPVVEGVVLNKRNDLLEISIGEDDGLLVGHNLFVSRSGNHLARVVVIKVDPDRSVVKVKSLEAPIQISDKVQTRPKQVAIRSTNVGG